MAPSCRTYALPMFCRSCQYKLVGLNARRCPECGCAFDPADPKTFAKRRPGPRALIGFGLALVVGVVAILGFWVALKPNYGDARHAAFGTLLGIGVCGGLVAAVLAAWNRAWLGRVPLLVVGVLCVWIGLFLGSDHYYRVWQSMSDPPDEAFADTGPFGALFLGWLPGAVVVGAAFGLASVVFALRRRRSERRIESRVSDQASLDA